MSVKGSMKKSNDSKVKAGWHRPCFAAGDATAFSLDRDRETWQGKRPRGRRGPPRKGKGVRGIFLAAWLVVVCAAAPVAAQEATNVCGSVARTEAGVVIVDDVEGEFVVVGVDLSAHVGKGIAATGLIGQGAGGEPLIQVTEYEIVDPGMPRPTPIPEPGGLEGQGPGR